MHFGGTDAQEWALTTERRSDLGEPASRSKTKDPTTLGDLIDLHVTDMREVLRAPRRSKAFTLDALNTKLGKLKLKDLTRERLIQFGKDHAREGAGPVTMDIGYTNLVVSHASAVHEVRVPVEPMARRCDCLMSRDSIACRNRFGCVDQPGAPRPQASSAHASQAWAQAAQVDEPSSAAASSHRETASSALRDMP